MSQWYDIAAADSLPPGQCRSVEVRGRRLALANVGGVFHAMDDTCPHRGVPLGAGYLDGQRLFCPLHGWEFDATTGACVTRPDRPLQKYPVEVQDGRVIVELEA
ncbi:MAG TPA: Rieske 2Fe-2S domain-containing protein [Verrucomicrobiota bacterium]|nr:(2Fe-2S)-binding protein [Verrucomicrobiales bacterium]HRI16389.1 Rieske 2Fe-2S domain-containing protein [Verrucomicrobiota bacterium]